MVEGGGCECGCVFQLMEKLKNCYVQKRTGDMYGTQKQTKWSDIRTTVQPYRSSLIIIVLQAKTNADSKPEENSHDSSLN